MTEKEKEPITRLPHSTERLRRLILENPDLPLLVFAGEDANCGDYSYQACTNICVDIGEFLDCHQKIREEIVYTDRENLEDDIWADIEREAGDCATGVAMEQLLRQRMDEYAPYWKKCIILNVDNN